MYLGASSIATPDQDIPYALSMILIAIEIDKKSITKKFGCKFLNTDHREAIKITINGLIKIIPKNKANDSIGFAELVFEFNNFCNLFHLIKKCK